MPMRLGELDQLRGHAGRDGLPLLVEGNVALGDTQGFGHRGLRRAYPGPNRFEELCRHGANTSAASLACQQRRYLRSIALVLDHPRMQPASDKRGKVTQLHKVEAARLLKIWLQEKPRLAAAGYGTQEAFGSKFKIGNQSAVGFFLNGKSALSLKAAIGFANGLQCDIKDFSPRLDAMLARGDAAPMREDAPAQSPQAARLAHLIDEISDPDVKSRAYILCAALAEAARAGQWENVLSVLREVSLAPPPVQPTEQQHQHPKPQSGAAREKRA